MKHGAHTAQGNKRANCKIGGTTTFSLQFIAPVLRIVVCKPANLMVQMVTVLLDGTKNVQKNGRLPSAAFHVQMYKPYHPRASTNINAPNPAPMLLFHRHCRRPHHTLLEPLINHPFFIAQKFATAVLVKRLQIIHVRDLRGAAGDDFTL
jgi:hypothetical protein